MTPPAGAPALTVVVLSRNRVPELMATLERLTGLPERPPVIVVDNGSRDGSPARVAQRFPGVELLALPDNRGASARTLGVRAAKTPWVAFADDDSWWAPASLSRAAELLEANPRVALLAARVLVGTEERLDPTCVEMRESALPPNDGPGPRVLGFLACGAVVRRSAYLAVGGFHPRYGVGGEEALLAADLSAAGWSLVYRDDVVAHHRPSKIRDRSVRRSVEVRNELWTAWLRRRLPYAVRASARAFRRAGDRNVRNGVLAAAAGSPWVLRERRAVPVSVERELELLDSVN